MSYSVALVTDANLAVIEAAYATWTGMQCSPVAAAHPAPNDYHAGFRNGRMAVATNTQGEVVGTIVWEPNGHISWLSIQGTDVPGAAAALLDFVQAILGFPVWGTVASPAYRGLLLAAGKMTESATNPQLITWGA